MGEPFGAIAPGTDLAQHARVLARLHDAVLGGGRPPLQPRALVARSWARALGSGLDADGANAREPVAVGELERRRTTTALRLVLDELRGVLTSVAEASQFLMVVCDADGVILWREGAAGVRLRADRLGFTEGAYWTEDVVGTNAIGTALAEAAPVQLFSAEHFEQQQHPWYCTAAPVHDPRTGELLGVVDVSGPAMTLHPALTSLVESAVRLAEMRLWRLHEERLEQLRRSAGPLLSGLNGPLLVVDDHGWVAHQSGLARRDRIEAPRADHAVAVPGIGLCLPERIGTGWLVRPHTVERRLSARLSLRAQPLLEVVTPTDSWRITLTPRHAQILALLAEAPAGMSTLALSIALYGDADHAVSTRAEVSRLRRAVGALVSTNPYRLADEVELEVRPAATGG